MTDTVSEAAVEVAQRAYETFGQQGHMKTRRPSDACMKAVLSAALPLLVAGERERCAKIADRWTGGSAPSSGCARAIAEAIRAGKGGE